VLGPPIRVGSVKAEGDTGFLGEWEIPPTKPSEEID